MDATFDAVVCVGRRDLSIAQMAIRSLGLFTRARRVLVLTARAHFDAFGSRLGARVPVACVDEDEAVEGVTRLAIEQRLQARIGSEKRAGWYLQQFLKLGACRLPGLPGRYLAWDGDTIALRPLEFLDGDGRVLVNPTSEHHAPYFEAIERLLGLPRGADHSFVSEHMLVETGLMEELLARLAAPAVRARRATVPAGGTAGADPADAAARADAGLAPLAPWAAAVLDAIDDAHLGHSGFSEYEIYGAFLAHRRPDGFRPRRLKALRHGKGRLGPEPGAADLFRLMLLGYATVSFERWDTRSKGRIRANRLASRVVHAAATLGRGLSGDRGGRLAAADGIAAPEVGRG